MSVMRHFAQYFANGEPDVSKWLGMRVQIARAQHSAAQNEPVLGSEIQVGARVCELAAEHTLSAAHTKIHKVVFGGFC